MSTKLVELVEWLRGRLETLHRGQDPGCERDTVHALIRACDPETNPRLAATLEEIERGDDAVRDNCTGTTTR